jgi:hypothetical protein
MPIHTEDKRKARRVLVNGADPGPSHPGGYCGFVPGLTAGGQNMDVYAHVTGAMALYLYQDLESFKVANDKDRKEYYDAKKNNRPKEFQDQKMAEMMGNEYGWEAGRHIERWLTNGQSDDWLTDRLKNLLCANG